MALPATDNFNRADGPIGSNWTALTYGAANGHNIVSNQALAAAGTYCFSVWNADSFNPNHYSQATLVNTNFYNGVGVRMSSSGTVNGYLFLGSFGADARCYRIDAGAFTLVISGLAIPAAGSVVKMTAVADLMKAYDDGVEIASFVDSTYATGTTGIWSYDDISAHPYLEDWSADNIAAVVNPASLRVGPHRRASRAGWSVSSPGSFF